MDLTEVMDVLEKMEDEALAAKLLAELNQKTKALGQLIMNQSNDLSHAEWKTQCDDLKKEVDDFLDKILSYK